MKAEITISKNKHKTLLITATVKRIYIMRICVEKTDLKSTSE